MPIQSIQRTSVGVLVMLFCFAGGQSGCQEPEPPVEAEQPPLEEAFVPVYRQVPGDAIVERRAALETVSAAGVTGLDANQDFYLAIRKSELGQKWFLGGFVSQAAPASIGSGAANALSTRVVSFKVQNGKLFVFDVADDKISTDRFRPEVVIEAYPIISGYLPFEQLRGAGDYVLFDPAAGLNRFSLLQDVQNRWTSVEIALSFSQRFRKIPDGIKFEQVVRGAVRSAPPEDGESLTATLSLALRRYTEGQGYVPTALPRVEHYFRSPPRYIPNVGRVGSVASKWNIHPGVAPVVWKIAPLGEQLRQDPRWQDIDFTGAIQTGIESWNASFGFPAIRAELAGPDESHGDDDVNYFIFDNNRGFGFAFANWRSNPNNGEVRGASVYFALGILGALGELPFRPFSPDGLALGLDGPVPAPTAATSGPLAGRRLSWGETAAESLCDLTLPSAEEILAAGTAAADADAFSRKERIERFVGHVAAHEIGHTLGLRHNFKGSLRPPSSSVMDYLDLEESIVMGPQPGSYDVAAIRHLYGLSPDLPADPFCTDEQVAVFDPDCRRGDIGAKPLTDTFIPIYSQRLEAFLAGRDETFLSPSLIVPHLRFAASDEVRVQAYEGIMALLRSPVSPPPGAPPSFEARLDVATSFALFAMFVSAQPMRPMVLGQPPPSPFPVRETAVPDLKALLVNSDGIRSPKLRRLAVDVLKGFQTRSAYTVLAEAREILAAQIPALEGNAAVDTRDLVSRIDRTLVAYFD
jgi:hypothetical protein